MPTCLVRTSRVDQIIRYGKPLAEQPAKIEKMDINNVVSMAKMRRA